MRNPSPHSNSEGEAPDVRDPLVAVAVEHYWRKNVRIMGVLLAAWAFVGLGCGILFAPWLNGFYLGGFPLGFWFAQQGSIIAFVVLILVYCLALNRLDAEHHRELEKIRSEREGTGPEVLTP